MSAAESATPAAAHFDAMQALGFVSSDEVKASAYARVLLLGAGKSGKTHSLLSTSPGPITIINCDNPDATAWSASQGARFFEVSVGDRKTWRSWDMAVGMVTKAAEAGHIHTLIVDSISVLCDKLYDEITVTTADKFEAYGMLSDRMSRLRRLLDLPCHVFLVGHISKPLSSEADEGEGIVPLLKGNSRQKVINIVNHIVLFDYVHGRAPSERTFVIGPQKNWSYGGRGIKRSTMVPATVPALFGELGITP